MHFLGLMSLAPQTPICAQPHGFLEFFFFFFGGGGGGSFRFGLSCLSFLSLKFRSWLSDFGVQGLMVEGGFRVLGFKALEWMWGFSLRVKL